MDHVNSGIVSKIIVKIVQVGVTEAIKKAKSLRGARSELKRLQQTLNIIRAQVHDAEGYQGGKDRKSVNQWLLNMKHVVYQAEDLFDKVLTLDRLDQRRVARRRVISKVRIFISKPNHNRKLVNEINSIRQQLDALKSDMDNLRLPSLPAHQISINPSIIEERETGTFVDTSSVIGRENEAKKIIDMLFDPRYGEQITVIPIVDFGGLGKTTLAHVVFNDARVQQLFDTTAWACVPEKNNLNAIKRKIFRAFTHSNSQDPTIVEIEEGIRVAIANKKYLLVLDDLWTEDGADVTDLLTLLKQGKKGTKLIVTTWNDVVANLAMHFGPIDSTYKLETLSDDKSWKLFKNLAFITGQEEPGLSRMGKEIVKMCGNVPLAIKVVASSLRSNADPMYWLSVKDSLSKADDKVMAILKLSYDSLSIEAKACFAYCSLFPKGHEFEKKCFYSFMVGSRLYLARPWRAIFFGFGGKESISRLRGF